MRQPASVSRVTIVCGGGSSGAKPGLSGTVNVGTAAITAFLELRGFSGLGGLAGLIGSAASFDLSTYCSSDPPPDPGITAGDIADALNLMSPSISLPAIVKLQQWFGSQYWYQLCQCSTVPTPAPPTPSNPGPISTNPGLPGALAAPCFQTKGNPSIVPTSASQHIDLSAQFLPATGAASTVNIASPPWGSGPFTIQAFPIPPNTSGPYFDGLYTGTNYGSIGGGAELVYVSVNASNAVLAQANIGAYPSGEVKYPLNGAWDTGQTKWAVYLAWGGSLNLNQVYDWSLTAGALCGQGLETACCPPDLSLDNKLNQILGLLQTVYSTLPVRVPNYAASPAHTGLTGQGSLALASTTIALKVEITTFPSVYGVLDSNPLTYFDVGYVTPVNNEGPESGFKLTRAVEIVPLPEATSAVDYSLPPGEVISVSELQAG